MSAFEEIKQHISGKKSFVLEAGAGSGKTYTLVQTLKFLIENKSEILENNSQKIICITYTNVAKNEIIKRIENNQLVRVLTIHEFLWESIKSFQKQLKIELCKLNEIRFKIDEEKGKESKPIYIPNLAERIENINSVYYDDSAFRNFEIGLLHHDDVIELACKMFENYNVLTTIIAQKYPFIFVDEYQDTAKEVATSLIEHLLERNKEILIIGFYGDSHQKIYDSGVGDLEKYYLNIEDKKLELVKKEENYRSSKNVVELLNNFRTNITQIPQKNIDGTVMFLFWKNHPQKPKKDIKAFNNSLKELKNNLYNKVIKKLEQNEWDFSEESDDKILVLANRRIAERAGFPSLFEIYNARFKQSTREKLMERENNIIRFFLGYFDKKAGIEREIGIEHLIMSWENGDFNSVIKFIKKNGSCLDDFQHSKKKLISDLISELYKIRKEKKANEVYKYIIEKGISNKQTVEDFINRKNLSVEGIEEDEIIRLEKDKKFITELLELEYHEILNLWKHTQNHSVFSTKHGTKGEEYRNVLTVIDDTEWKSDYNFEKFFENSDDIVERKIRTRNLFYVECSRAKENLVVLALSEMSNSALQNVKSWFGEKNVLDIEEFLKT